MEVPPSHYWRNVLIIVPIVATIFFILRLYYRNVVAHKLRVDDILMGMGLLCTYGVATCQVYSAVHGIGIDQSIWVLPCEERLRITLVNWILIKFWPSAQVFVKVSILLFLRRLLGCNERFRHAATAVIVFIVAWGLTAVIVNTLLCWPVQYFWIKHIEGHCICGRNTFFLIIGSLSVVEDVVVLCLPCQFKHYQTDDLTMGSSLNLVWTILELDMVHRLLDKDASEDDFKTLLTRSKDQLDFIPPLAFDNIYAQDVFYRAIHKKRLDVLPCMLERQNVDNWNSLHLDVVYDNLEVVKKLGNKIPELGFVVDRSGRTPLHLAFVKCNV